MYIFLAGKPLQHICGKVISLHTCNNSNSYIYLEFIILPEKCKQSKGSIYFSFGSLYHHSHLFRSFSSHISCPFLLTFPRICSLAEVKSGIWHIVQKAFYFRDYTLKQPHFQRKKTFF